MFLQQILGYKKIKIEEDKKRVPADELFRQIDQANKPMNATERLLSEEMDIIAEVKKASPSKGLIKEDFDPIEIAKEYEKNNVSAISVLTEDKFFQGRNEYLRQIRKAVSIPVLRKDFIIDPYQIIESRVLGADIILLIAAILKEEEIIEFSRIARELDLQILMEIHEESEIERALKGEPDIIGINNRDLKSFHTDIKNTEALIKLLPKNKPIISESGIDTKEDMSYLKNIGAKGVLIGESLMRSDSITEKIKELRSYDRD